MSDKRSIIADRAADVTLSQPHDIGQGFLPYHRFDLTLTVPGDQPSHQQRDILRGGGVAAVIPIDLERDQIVLLRQFRLAAHLATGRGEMVEIVAGRIDEGESPIDAARRECHEEIGLMPQAIAELYSVVPSPGVCDEYVTFFLASVDATSVPERGGTDENESTRPFVVSIDDAIAALGSGAVENAPLVSALQWLALNRSRLSDLLSRASV